METIQAALPEDPTTEPAIVWPDLTAHDRCVGRTATGPKRTMTTCNAEAFVRYAKDGADLTFCGHCHGIHGMALEFQGFQVVQDRLHVINAKSESSA